MRIAVVALAGIALALLTSFGVVRVVTTSEKEPVVKTLYNYGSR
jgi:hypothetical protein